jgi:hypothetical protein
MKKNGYNLVEGKLVEGRTTPKAKSKIKFILNVSSWQGYHNVGISKIDNATNENKYFMIFHVVC